MNSQFNIPTEHFQWKTSYYYFFNFHGMSNKYLDTFLFCFIVLFHGYDYSFDAHNLNFFLDPLKEEEINWFMILGGYIIENGKRVPSIPKNI